MSIDRGEAPVTPSERKLHITIPDGFRFGSLHMHAKSWDAYDSLTEADGWIERAPDHVDGRTRIYKTIGQWPLGTVAAYPPLGKRVPSERRIALKTVVRGYPFVVLLPFLGSIGSSTPDELIINGRSLSDEELARGYYDETERRP